jgi:hypothetical protein
MQLATYLEYRSTMYLATCMHMHNSHETLKLKGGQGTTPALEYKVRHLYGHFNLAWHGDERTFGLLRIEHWVGSTGYKGTWISATCEGLRSPMAEERNLLWLALHSAPRLG